MKTARQILIATKKRKNIPLIKYLTIEDICEAMEEYAKLKLKDAYLEGFENGWERKEGGVSAFGVSEDLADKYVNIL